MLAALLFPFISRERRIWFFSIGALACLPALAICGVQLVLAKDAAQATVFGLLCAASLLGSLTHASIVGALVSENRGLLFMADFQAVVGLAAASAREQLARQFRIASKVPKHQRKMLRFASQLQLRG
jgi:hypothetical protein